MWVERVASTEKKLIEAFEKKYEMPTTSTSELINVSLKRLENAGFEINHKLFGLKRGRLHLIGARSSHGKSAMSLQIAYDLASQGKKVLFLSLEMTNAEMVERIFCNVYKINNYP